MGQVKLLSALFREAGMEVYAFCEPEGRPDGLDAFVFEADQWDGPLPLEMMNWKKFMDSPLTERAYLADKAGLDWADTAVLVLPCGRSSHMEAGYAVGQGKELFIYGDLPIGEFETMYGFSNGLFRYDEIHELMATLKKPKGESLI